MKAKQQGGFSLLELLVALFVVVIITSLVTLSVNSGGEDIELDATVKSLADVSSYALDEAQLRGVNPTEPFEAYRKIIFINYL